MANAYIPQALCRDAHGLDRFKPAREEEGEKRKTGEEKNVEEKEREKKRE